jgi:hypothetical protein
MNHNYPRRSECSQSLDIGVYIYRSDGTFFPFLSLINFSNNRAASKLLLQEDHYSSKK